MTDFQDAGKAARADGAETVVRGRWRGEDPAEETVVRGTWRFDAGHALFADHFPGAPRVPGTLLIEAMRAEAARRFPGWRAAGVRRFRFRRFVEPGEYGYVLSLRPDAAAIRCVLLCGDERMAEGSLLVEPEAACV